MRSFACTLAGSLAIPVAIRSQLQAIHAEVFIMATTKKIAGISLNQDVLPINAVGLLFGVCCMVFCFIGLNMVQPWLLEHHLNLPTSETGDATGTLGAIGQIITVLLAGAMGALADIKGRRLVLILGVVVMGLGILIGPLGSSYRGGFRTGTGFRRRINDDYPTGCNRRLASFRCSRRSN